MRSRLKRLQDATQQRAADLDSLLLSVLLPPVVEIPDAVASSARRFVAFVCWMACATAVALLLTRDVRCRTSALGPFQRWARPWMR
jgi:hypothetical protein